VVDGGWRRYLKYDLPIGLVGGAVNVTMTGEMDNATSTTILTGDAGEASCAIVDQVVTCHEQLSGIGAMPINMEEVRRVAVAEFRGPVSAREDIATIFGSDPIGIASFNLSPSAGHGGGGKGGSGRR
jgi:hypothetical protein